MLRFSHDIEAARLGPLIKECLIVKAIIKARFDPDNTSCLLHSCEACVYDGMQKIAAESATRLQC
jgi:hypothetical protein